MDASQPHPRRVRFGPYELDESARELRKNGLSIHLQDQPWEVLRTLVERPGEVVSREDLRRRLWPDGTFVDYEQSLNKAVNKLREALCDSADRPRYVETLARRGYRFVAAVEVEAPPEPVVAPPATAPEPPAAVAGPPIAGRWRRWLWIAGLAALVALLLVTGLWPPPQPVVKVTPITDDARGKGGYLAVTGGRVLYDAYGLGKDADRSELWSVPAAGGEARSEPTPCEVSTLLLGASYLRQRLFLLCFGSARGPDLWLTGFDGSGPKWIGPYSLGRFRAASISPSQQTMLFSSNEGLFAQSVDGGAERLLVRPDAWNYLSPTFWHPAGNRIGFLRRVGGHLEFWEVRADGTGLRPLVPEFSVEIDGAEWSPDGRRLYFVSQGEIYLQRNRGWLGWMRRPAPLRLTSGAIHFIDPFEDPADPLVIYARGYVAPQATAMKLDRKTNTWEPFLGGLAADCVNYSADGQWIAYVHWLGGELWKCRRDGRGKQVLEDALFTYNPRWSPDGSRIAFSGSTRGRTGGYDDTQPFHIYTISARGGKPEPVRGVPGPAFDPDWSPDGKRLAFAPFSGEAAKEQQHVSIVNLETGAVEAVPGSDNLWSARWSPDGNSLVALSCDKSWPYIYSFATQKWTVLQPTNKGFPHWSRDSRSVYFKDDSETRLVRIAVATGKLEEVRKLSGFDITGVLGNGAFWTPDEEPVVLKPIVSSQIYRIERDR